MADLAKADSLSLGVAGQSGSNFCAISNQKATLDQLDQAHGAWSDFVNSAMNFDLEKLSCRL